MSCINLVFLRDARKKALTLLLFILFGTCVFYIHHTAQQVQHHFNNYRHHTIVLFIVLFVVVSRTIRDLHQTTRIFPHHSLAYFLGLEMIRATVQPPWVYLNCFNTHLLCFETVRNKKKYYRPNTYYLVARFLGLKILRDK